MTARRKAAGKKASSSKARAPARGKVTRKQKAGAATRGKRRVFSFGNGKADGRTDMRELLGGKGAGLAEMTRLGVPVPPGFTISTEVCSEFEKAGGRLSSAVKKEALAAMTEVERLLGTYEMPEADAALDAEARAIIKSGMSRDDELPEA